MQWRPVFLVSSSFFGSPPFREAVEIPCYLANLISHITSVQVVYKYITFISLCWPLSIFLLFCLLSSAVRDDDDDDAAISAAAAASMEST